MALNEDIDSINDIIKFLQSNFWARRLNYSILSIREYNQRFFALFKRAKPYIERVTRMELKINNRKTENILSISKLDCLSLLSALFFCCSKQIHTFLDKAEKTKFLCMISYFEYMFDQHPETLERETLSIGFNKPAKKADQLNFKVRLKKVFIDKEARIEDLDDDNHLKIDFANMHIGGGVLNYGCVQEEILFSIYPELLVSMFFCKTMEDNEAIFIKGARRMANYSGYAWTFTFEGVCKQSEKPSNNVFVAIDALVFDENRISEQFNERVILREINKAYAGFSIKETDDGGRARRIATGKWGCGAFHGYPPLKFIIMWIAASLAERDMVMCTFGDEYYKEIKQIFELFQNSTVYYLYGKLLQFKDYSDPIGEIIKNCQDEAGPRLKNLQTVDVQPVQREEFKMIEAKFNTVQIGENYWNQRSPQENYYQTVQVPRNPDYDTQKISKTLSVKIGFEKDQKCRYKTVSSNKSNIFSDPLSKKDEEIFNENKYRNSHPPFALQSTKKPNNEIDSQASTLNRNSKKTSEYQKNVGTQVNSKVKKTKKNKCWPC